MRISTKLLFLKINMNLLYFYKPNIKSIIKRENKENLKEFLSKKFILS